MNHTHMPQLHLIPKLRFTHFRFCKNIETFNQLVKEKDVIYPKKKKKVKKVLTRVINIFLQESAEALEK